VSEVKVEPPFGYPHTALKATVVSIFIPALGLLLISHRYFKRFLICFLLSWTIIPYFLGLYWSYKFGKKAVRIYEETKPKPVKEVKSEVRQALTSAYIEERELRKTPLFEEGIEVPAPIREKLENAWKLHEDGKHDLAIMSACIALEGALRQLYEYMVGREDRAKGYEEWTIRNYAENLRAIKAISDIEQAELFALHDLRNYVAHY
jgi:hypothetical protein